VAMVLSPAMLLKWLARRHGNPDLRAASRLVEMAMDDVVGARIRTRDLGGECPTDEFTAHVVATLQSGGDSLC